MLYASDPFRGSKRRRIASPGVQSSELETEAGLAALEDARVDPKDIDLLLVYSVVPDFPAPLNHPILAAKLKLRRDVAAMSFSTECSSFVSQLFVACRLLESGEFSKALIVQSALTSRVTDYRQPSSVVIGDGACACVVERLNSGYGYIGHTQFTRGELHGGVRVAPEVGPSTPWYRGDVHGSALTAQPMDISAVTIMGLRPASMCREVCENLLRKTGTSVDQVDFFCTSQPTVWFGHACADALGIPRDKALNTFAEYGHLMAASAPLNLHAAREREVLSDGDLILFYSPGAGFTQSALLYRWGGHLARGVSSEAAPS